MAKLIILFILTVVAGCSSGGGYQDGFPAPIDPPSGTATLLKSVAFSGNVLQVEQRFVSYTKKAGRVSIIDPHLEIEVWGKTASGFDFAVELPGLQGVTLFNSSRVTVMTNSSTRSFNLNSTYLHTTSAMNQPAYSVASSDGRSFEIIRFLGGGQWQHETFIVPWEAFDPFLTSPPSGQPPLLITRFNDNGTMLTAFSPSDGRYAVYAAASKSGPILNTATWCTGDGIGTPQDATFSSVVWDHTIQQYFAGDRNGRIYALDPFGPCRDSNNPPPSIRLPDSIPVYRVSMFSSGRIAVLQDDENVNGILSFVVFDGNNFTIESTNYNNFCEVPLNSLNLSDSHIIIMCTTDSFLKTDSTTSHIEPRVYVTLESSTGDILTRFTIDKENTSAVAIDIETKTFYRMLEGAFGTLEITDLITGTTRRHVGLFIVDILN